MQCYWLTFCTKYFAEDFTAPVSHPVTFPLLKAATDPLGLCLQSLQPNGLSSKASAQTEADGESDSNRTRAELVPWPGFTFRL